MKGWWGRIIGAVLGFMLLSIPGALVGFVIGALIDHAVNNHFGNTLQVRQAFFNALFVSMGHLARADGRVTSDEINAARTIMRHLNLTPENTLQAMELFNQGKEPGFDLKSPLIELRKTCNNRRNLLHMFMMLQLQAAYADGVLHPNELAVLQEMASLLGFTPAQFSQMNMMYQAQSAFQSAFSGGGYSSGYQGYSSGSSSHYTQSNPHQELKNAYAVLGLEETTPFDQVKKTYRQLMNQYHPDKLVAKGLPDDMMKAATEKVQQIKAAYEFIKERRGE